VPEGAAGPVAAVGLGVVAGAADDGVICPELSGQRICG
jgi:hypothetical protein